VEIQDNVLSCFDFGLPFANMAADKGDVNRFYDVLNVAVVLELHFAHVYVLISQNL
jgi:hypothetical protein